MASIKEYWSSMTPKQRSEEVKRRLGLARKRRARARQETPTTESPFPQESLMESLTKPRRNVRGMIADLSGIVDELKQMFGD
jgi:hypothetical protein